MASATVSEILQTINSLTPGEQAELHARLARTVTNGHTPITNMVPAPDPKDDTAFQWINENESAYPGEWLALNGDRLLAHGFDLREVAATARAAGVQYPLLHLVEPPRKYPYIRS